MMASRSAVIAQLDAISRSRPLTLAESLELERAVSGERHQERRRKRLRQKRREAEWDWRPEEDEIILKLRAKRIRGHKLTYRDIAELLDAAGISRSLRTEWAVSSRIRALREKEGG